MRRRLKLAYHFLGGVRFAIILIAVTATLVIAGTLMESHTGSHEYADKLIYGTPLFSLLLWGFFLNILIAALRRWPFQKKHIPFLITHWGLLMILGGALIKHYAGIQGSMFLLEGSSSDQLMLPGSQALRVDSPQNTLPTYLPLPFPTNPQRVGELELALQQCFPHCSERLDTFIKGGWAVIAEAPPFPIDVMVEANIGASNWTLLAKKNILPEEGIRAYYTENTTLRMSQPSTGTVVAEKPLLEALDSDFLVEGKRVTAELRIEHSTITGLDNPTLTVRVGRDIIEVALDGAKALFNQTADPAFGSPPLAVDLLTSPALLFLQDDHKDMTLAAIGPHGDISTQTFRPDNLSSLYSYDQGYGGYSMQAFIKTRGVSRQEQEQQHLDNLKKKLAAAEIRKEELTPPLQLLWDACHHTGTNFADTCIDYLCDWSRLGGWLYPQDRPLRQNLVATFAALDWALLPESELKGCVWSAALIQGMTQESTDAVTLLSNLEQHRWPFVSEIWADPKSKDGSYVLAAFTRQLFAAADELPPPMARTAGDPQENAHLFSNYCRAYGLHLSSIAPAVWDNANIKETTLECPLSTNYKPHPPTSKIEENIPLLVLRARNNGRSEQITLSFDRTAQGLKWPVADGSYLLRFQPQFVALPYEVRLRRARQISYPNTNQPYSYESDLVVTDIKTGKSIETTISMNNVHETWDGYRFYLASMSPSDESAAKRIQLAVNLDPAKYYLTYPGAIILSLGIILLFWLRPYKRSKT